MERFFSEPSSSIGSNQKSTSSPLVPIEEPSARFNRSSTPEYEAQDIISESSRSPKSRSFEWSSQKYSSLKVAETKESEPRDEQSQGIYRFKDYSMPMLLYHGMQFGISVLPFHSIALGDYIGTGASMIVHYGTIRNVPVAVKVVRLSLPDGKSKSEIERTARERSIRLEDVKLELSVLSRSSLKLCENIVNLYGLTWTEVGPDWCRLYQPYIIVEPAHRDHHTLDKYISHIGPNEVGIKAALISDIIHGLEALYFERIVHGDLKPENILIFKSAADEQFPFVAKLSDFGFSLDESALQQFCGRTRYWAAPEWQYPRDTMDHVHSLYTMDVYSLGLIAMYVFMGHLPVAPLELLTGVDEEDRVSKSARRWFEGNLRLSAKGWWAYNPFSMRKYQNDLEFINSSIALFLWEELSVKIKDTEDLVMAGYLQQEFLHVKEKTWNDAEGFLPVMFGRKIAECLSENPLQRPGLGNLRIRLSTKKDANRSAESPLLGHHNAVRPLPYFQSSTNDRRPGWTKLSSQYESETPFDVLEKWEQELKFEEEITKKDWLSLPLSPIKMIDQLFENLMREPIELDPLEVAQVIINKGFQFIRNQADIGIIVKWLIKSLPQADRPEFSKFRRSAQSMLLAMTGFALQDQKDRREPLQEDGLTAEIESTWLLDHLTYRVSDSWPKGFEDFNHCAPRLNALKDRFSELISYFPKSSLLYLRWTMSISESNGLPNEDDILEFSSDGTDALGLSMKFMYAAIKSDDDEIFSESLELFLLAKEKVFQIQKLTETRWALRCDFSWRCLCNTTNSPGLNLSILENSLEYWYYVKPYYKLNQISQNETWPGSIPYASGAEYILIPNNKKSLGNAVAPSVSVPEEDGNSNLSIESLLNHINDPRPLDPIPFPNLKQKTVEEVQLIPALHAAIYANNWNTFIFMLLLGADPNLTYNGHTPLSLAINMNRLSFVLALLEFGAEVKTTTPAVFSPLEALYALMNRLYQHQTTSQPSEHLPMETCGILGLYPNVLSKEDTSELLNTMSTLIYHSLLHYNDSWRALRSGPYGITGLQYVFHYGFLEGPSLWTLRSDTMAILKRDFYGQNVLHYISKFQVSGFAEKNSLFFKQNTSALIKNCRNLPFVANFLGETPVHNAARIGQQQTLELIFSMYNKDDVKKMLSTTSHSSTTPLHEAIRHKRHDTFIYLVHKILEVGGTPLLQRIVNMPFTEGHVLLHYAPALFPHTNTISNDRSPLYDVTINIVLPLVLDANVSTHRGFTALHYAAIGNSTITKDLLNIGCLPSMRDENGKTPLELAIAYDSFAVIKILQNVSDDIINGESQSPEFLHLKNNYIRIFKVEADQFCHGVTRTELKEAIRADITTAWTNQVRPDFRNLRRVTQNATSKSIAQKLLQDIRVNILEWFTAEVDLELGIKLASDNEVD